jgi:hypothetical protein
MDIGKVIEIGERKIEVPAWERERRVEPAPTPTPVKAPEREKEPA